MKRLKIRAARGAANLLFCLGGIACWSNDIESERPPSEPNALQDRDDAAGDATELSHAHDKSPPGREPTVPRAAPARIETSTDAASADAATVDGRQRCGQNACEGSVVQGVDVAPCCVLDAEGKQTAVCGLRVEDLSPVFSNPALQGCVPANTFARSPSEYCGEVWDRVESGGDANAALDLRSGSQSYAFAGCCLGNGVCGAQLSSPIGGDSSTFDLGLGCVSFLRLTQDSGPVASAGGIHELDLLPYCDPSTGEALPEDSQTLISGLPRFRCGCGAEEVNSNDRLVPCLNHFPVNVCGNDEPTQEDLAGIPEFVCGCPEAPRLPCLSHTPTQVCGTLEIAASSPELATVPRSVCGCGSDKTDDNSGETPCLSHVEAAVCGML